MKKDKTPDSKKQEDLQQNKENGQDEFLTTNQGVRISDDQNSLKAGGAGRRCWRISSCEKKSPTSTTSGFRSGLSTRGARRRTVIFRCTNR